MAEHESSLDDDETIWTTGDVARVLRRRPETVRMWQRHGDGPDCFKIRGRIYYRAGAVRQWLAQYEHAGR